MKSFSSISNFLKSTSRKFSLKRSTKNSIPLVKTFGHAPPLRSNGYTQKYESISGVDDDRIAGYKTDPIAFQCVNLISNAVASIPLHVRKRKASCGGDFYAAEDHPIVKLINKPNMHTSSYEFMALIVSHLLIYGDCFIRMIGVGKEMQELQIVHPSRVEYLVDSDEEVRGYQITSPSNNVNQYLIHQITGMCEILHIKGLSPSGELSSISPMSVAMNSIALRQEANQWSQSLLRNGARVSAAIIVKGGVGSEPLSEEQFMKLKSELDDCLHDGGVSRPMIIDSPNRDIEWRQIGMSPKDYDYNETKDTASCDISRCFGVPRHLIDGFGKGDGSYQNMKEARLNLWEQTVIPLEEKILANLNGWIAISELDPMAEICYDENDISALATKRDYVWNRVKDASFLSDEEKRCLVGLPSFSIGTKKR